MASSPRANRTLPERPLKYRRALFAGIVMLLNNKNGKIRTEQLALVALAALAHINDLGDIEALTVDLLGHFKDVLGADVDADAAPLAVSFVNPDHDSPRTPTGSTDEWAEEKGGAIPAAGWITTPRKSKQVIQFIIPPAG